MDSEQRKVFYLLLLYMLGLSAGEGSFEDADKANDFLSQSHQHYDLRHTIPGEPDIDYPIYSAVPKTSFSCAQKHEGYYADIESRCQAFRICTNTARNTAGFGFLCPNGTLFSQRHFVCDWYRNVRCEESEQFFNKNAHNRISNHYEMMETVRQMIEYPMKTISKALAQKQVQTKLQAPRSYATNQQVKAAPKPTVVSLTASQVAPSYGTTLLRPIMTTTPKLLLSESRPTLSNTNSKRTQEVYVNSFGELSTDPGSKFDPKTARIIAKPEKPGSSFNFAESINFGLNEYFPAMNRNQKNIGNVDSNLNILRHEIQADVSAKKSVHRSTSSQEASASSNFISHGFSKSKKDYVKSTHYQFPKQTANTAKFSSYRNNQQTQYKQTIPLVPILPTTTTTNTYRNNQAIKPAEPNIIIARAEGQRIGSTSHAAFVPQQNKVSKVSSATSYESLNEFLHKKFGQTKATTAKPATRYYNTLPQRTSAAQEPTKHIVYAQPAQQQQLYTHRNVFSNLQQQQQPLQHHPQQPQLTFFNNNNNQLTLNSQAHNYRQVQQTGAYRNFKLPTVNDGIIPAAYTQVAQRRLDTFNFELETSTSTSPRMKLFSGVSSYDVPLSSVGRLPNDISQRLRRL